MHELRTEGSCAERTVRSGYQTVAMESHQRIFSWIESCKRQDGMPQYRQEKVTHGCSASAAGSTAGVSEQKSSLGQEISDAQRGSPLRGGGSYRCTQAWEIPCLPDAHMYAHIDLDAIPGVHNRHISGEMQYCIVHMIRRWSNFPTDIVSWTGSSSPLG